MRKITIKNSAEPEWHSVIESHVRLMLGSMLVHIDRIDVEFEVTADALVNHKTYTCKLLLVESIGERILFKNSQADGRQAIDGAIARARRAIARLKRSRSRVPGRWAASAW